MTVLLITLISLSPPQRMEFNTMFHPQIVWDPETCLTAPPNQNYIDSPSNPIAVGLDGQVHIVWFSSPPVSPIRPQIYYKRFVPDVGWTPDTCISADLARWHYCAYPEIACDSQGNIHTAWQEDGGYHIWYKMRRPDGVWDSVSTLLSVGSGTLPRGGVLVSCSPNGHIHTLWWESYHLYGTWLVYREKVDGVWQPSLVVDSVGPDSAIRAVIMAAGRDNRVHLVYILQGGDTLRYIYRYRSGTLWSPRELIHAGPDTFPAEGNFLMRVNPLSGEPHIIFYRDGGTYHSYRRNGVWQPRETLYMYRVGSDTGGHCSNFTFTRDGIGYALLREVVRLSPTRNILIYWYRERSRNGEWSPRYLVRAGDSLHYNNIYYHSGFTSGGDGPNPGHLYFLWNMADSFMENNPQIYFMHGAPGPQGMEWKEVMPPGFTPIKVKLGEQVEFNLKKAGFVRLGVYDVLGRQERLLIAGHKEPGRYMVRFPEGMASGVHFIQLETPDTRAVKKVVLVR